MSDICECTNCVDRRARAAAGDERASNEQEALDRFRHEMREASNGRGAWYLTTFFQERPRSCFVYVGGTTSAIFIAGAILKIRPRGGDEAPIAMPVPEGFPLPLYARGVELGLDQLEELTALWESLGLGLVTEDPPTASGGA